MTTQTDKQPTVKGEQRYVGFYISKAELDRFRAAIWKEHKTYSMMTSHKIRQLIDEYVHRILSAKEIKVVDEGKWGKEGPEEMYK